MIDYPYLREIRSPITRQQLRPLSPKCERVQFSEPLTDSDHKKLAHFMRAYPNVALRMYGHYFSTCNLDYLRYYPDVIHLGIDVHDLRDTDGIRYASKQMKSFSFGMTKSKGHSLSFLQGFLRLRALYLEAHVKNIEIIGSMTHLVNLSNAV